jgi:hypothetical protein
MEEEQEREVIHEIERERQVEKRDPPFTKFMTVFAPSSKQARLNRPEKIHPPFFLFISLRRALLRGHRTWS